MDGEGIFAECLDYMEEKPRAGKSSVTGIPKHSNCPWTLLATASVDAACFSSRNCTFETRCPDNQPSTPASFHLRRLLKSLPAAPWRARTQRELFARARPENWSQLVEGGGINRRASRRTRIAQAFPHSPRPGPKLR